MKVYSVLIVSVTLFVFYNLAVFQENICETTKNSSKDVSTSLLKNNLGKVNEDISNCRVSIEKISDKGYQEAHHVGQDDFALLVSGKDHQYLNTGVSLIVSDDVVHSCENSSIEIIALSNTVSQSASQSFLSQAETDILGGFAGLREVTKGVNVFDIGNWSGNNSKNYLESFLVQNRIVDAAFSLQNQDELAYLAGNYSIAEEGIIQDLFPQRIVYRQDKH